MFPDARKVYFSFISWFSAMFFLVLLFAFGYYCYSNYNITVTESLC